MINRFLSPLFCWLIICFSACQSQPEYCTVKGTVKGIKDGMQLELQDEFDHFKVIDVARVKDGAFEFHPHISAPTHVYMYSGDGNQLKDFFLEPGTIVADVDATDENDWTLGATGTTANNLRREIRLLYLNGEGEAAANRWDEIIDAGENGILALYYACVISNSAVKSLDVIDRLSPDIASKPYIAELREELTRRAKTEPVPEGVEGENYYIDMEYPDVDGKPISLSSVVNNPANRLILLDFWATWCGPCKMLAPTIAKIAEEKTGVLKVCKLDVDEEPEIAARYRISSIPTLMLFEKGQLKKTSIGVQPKAAIEAMLNS